MGILLGRSVAKHNLCPSGNSRTDGMSNVIVRNCLAQVLNEHGAFGSGPDYTHFTFQDVHELRNFVYPPLPHPLADPRDTRILRLRPAWTVHLRIVRHRATLQDRE